MLTRVKARARRTALAFIAGPQTRDAYTGWHDPALITMGRHSYGDPRVIAYGGDDGRVSIGPFCSIAANTTFMVGGYHRMDLITTHPLHTLGSNHPTVNHVTSNGDVVVGPDVWIGRDATIMSGVRIGAGAVIAARALVTRDVEPYTIVGGNPARPIRRRFSDEQCARLLTIAWWDWPDELIVRAQAILTSDDVDALARFGAETTGHSIR